MGDLLFSLLPDYSNNRHSIMLTFQAALLTKLHIQRIFN